jgi:hypothetical protein
MRRFSVALLAASLLFLSPAAVPAHASPASGPCGSRSGPAPKTFSHVITIVLENKAYSEVDGSSPYLNGLAKRCGVASNYFAITHPSLPNYMALTSGGTQFSDNCDSCSTTAVSIFDQVGSSWREYAEAMPRPGYMGAELGRYEKHHNPSSYYRRIASVYRTHAVPLGGRGRFRDTASSPRTNATTSMTAGSAPATRGSPASCLRSPPLPPTRRVTPRCSSRTTKAPTPTTASTPSSSARTRSPARSWT